MIVMKKYHQKCIQIFVGKVQNFVNKNSWQPIAVDSSKAGSSVVKLETFERAVTGSILANPLSGFRHLGVPTFLFLRLNKSGVRGSVSCLITCTWKQKISRESNMMTCVNGTGIRSNPWGVEKAKELTISMVFL